MYPIHFVNIGEIEAIDVFVTDTLDEHLDTSTLQKYYHQMGALLILLLELCVGIFSE